MKKKKKEKSKKKTENRWGPPTWGSAGPCSRSDTTPIAPGDRLLDWFREGVHISLQSRLIFKLALDSCTYQKNPFGIILNFWRRGDLA
jgi:hypothetical protein